MHFGIGRSTSRVGRSPVQFTIRQATPADAGIVAWHRARMFQDMGEIADDAMFEELRSKAESRVSEWLAAGKYVGWFAIPIDSPDKVVGGAGIQFERILPRPLHGTQVSTGRQGTVVNVFTEPEWRRRGVASLLVRHIVEWSKTQKLDRLLLHASDEGRSVYQRLGFATSNEMRLRATPAEERTPGQTG